MSLARAQPRSDHALVMRVGGPLTPVWLSYLERGVRAAEADNSELIVLQLNTPGGQIDLMDRIINVILTSPKPVVVFVGAGGGGEGRGGKLVTLGGQN
ncbi:MAG: nodulation protein NfeD, partial [Thermoflexales bacterium]